MAENNKEIHIVFQVLNFVLSPDADDLKLLPIDRLFLLALAKHHGIRGIYPTTHTLASELNISPTYVKRVINRLDACGLIRVDRKFGTRHHYHLLFLSTDRSTTVDTSTTVDRSTTVSVTGQPQFQNRSTTVDTININNQFRISKQRERKKRAPLSDSFLPNEKITPLWHETASKSGKSKEQLLAKFKNLQKSKEGMSADWNAEFENFLINEKSMGYTNGNGKGHSNGNGEIKNTVKFFDDPNHPNYAELKRIKEIKNMEEKQKQEAEAKPTEHLSFREAKRRFELSQQHGELKNDLSGNSSRGSGSV